MKLIDILAKTLTEWPAGHPCQVARISQSLTDTELYFLDDEGSVLWGRYISDQVAEDAGVYVTRAQWQAAVDALKAESAPAWVGVGSPPVGTVCEFHGSSAACPDDPWHPDLKDGDHVTIIAYFSDSLGQIAAFTFKARNENIASIQVEQARPGAFKPIRTPEQIAKEARNKACDQMYGVYLNLPESSRGNTSDLVEALYDSGYRKQATND